MALFSFVQAVLLLLCTAIVTSQLRFQAPQRASQQCAAVKPRFGSSIPLTTANARSNGAAITTLAGLFTSDALNLGTESALQQSSLALVELPTGPYLILATRAPTEAGRERLFVHLQLQTEAGGRFSTADNAILTANVSTALAAPSDREFAFVDRSLGSLAFYTQAEQREAKGVAFGPLPVAALAAKRACLRATFPAITDNARLNALCLSLGNPINCPSIRNQPGTSNPSSFFTSMQVVAGAGLTARNASVLANVPTSSFQLDLCFQPCTYAEPC